MTRISAFVRFSLLLALVVALPGCKTVGGWFGHDKNDKTETLGVEALYHEGQRATHNGNYSQASRDYTRLIARFPYGPYSEQSQLELAYVQYKLGKPEDAISSIDRFIRTYPRHVHIDYAYYLKAVINFDRETTFLTKITRTDVSARDLNAPMQSFNDFNDVISRYPNSIYAADARQRMVYLRNQLARHEITIASYYYFRGAYLASANRSIYLIENFPQSQYDGDAVALMAASYTKLGQKKLADDARSVLQLNYPKHPYLAGRWPKHKGFLRKLNPLAGELK